MARIPRPFSTLKRSDSKTLQITLNHICGLPERVCAKWRRRSFLDLPDELSPCRTPKTKSAAAVGAVALIAYLKNRQQKKLPAFSITIKDFAGDMFIEGAPHLARWTAKGKVFKRQTISQRRRGN
jgi:hypothetical protein